MSRPLDDLRLSASMLDGIELKGRCCVVALGIDSDGVKHPLGLWDGLTENATVATTLLATSSSGVWMSSRAYSSCSTAPRRQEGRPRRARRPHAGAALHPPQGAQRARPLG